MNRRSLLILLIPVFFPVALHAESPETIPLWPEGRMPGPPPLVEGEARDLTKDSDRLIAGRRIIKLGHVSTPEIQVYLPAEEKRNGAAVIICPGGGFSILAWDLEGTEVAEWLNEIGIAAVVLKYRVPTRQHGDEGTIAPKMALGPMQDAQRALSLTRAHAGEWNLDPERIGILGFSAGGQTAALAAVAKGKRAYESLDEWDQASCSADFALLIYPGGLADRETGELRSFYPVDAETPPMFFAHAADDRVTPLASTALFEALVLAGVPAEVHVFATGGHGYGLRATDSPVTRWPALAEDWIRISGLLESRREKLASFGRDQAKRYRAGEPLDQFSGKFPEATLEEAAVAQATYVGELGKTFAGVKGAVVGKGGQDFFGIDGPLSAVLFREGWHEASGKLVIAIREGANPGVETELGLILAKPIRDRLDSIDDLKKHVRSLVPVVELPAGRHAWPDKPRATDLVAANVDSDHFILGTETDDLSIDLDALPIRLLRGDEVLNQTTGGDAAGGQWSNFLHQVNWAVEQGYQLEAGHLVITGALGTIAKEGPGTYRADYGSMGSIEFTLSSE